MLSTRLSVLSKRLEDSTEQFLFMAGVAKVDLSACLQSTLWSSKSQFIQISMEFIQSAIISKFKERRNRSRLGFYSSAQYPSL